MKVVFLGSGPFGIPALEALHRLASRFPLLAVVTRPDRPAHRGRELRPTPVRERAGELGVACLVPETANSPEFLEELRALAADVVIVADYGEILRPQFLELPATGTFNLHASLLPRHRGAAPVAHALLGGETDSGVTLFRIERALDSGPVVARAELEIRPDETAGELESRLGLRAATLLEENLDNLATGRFEEIPQDHSQATLAPKLKKGDGLIRWDSDPESLHDFTRAMNPWPMAYSFLERPGEKSERTSFLRLEPEPVPEGATDTASGTVVAFGKHGFSIACRGGRVKALEIQREGKAALDAAAYLRGRRLEKGDRFGP